MSDAEEVETNKFEFTKPPNWVHQPEARSLQKIEWSRLNDQTQAKEVSILGMSGEPKEFELANLFVTTSVNCSRILNLDDKWTRRIWLLELPGTSFAKVLSDSELKNPMFIVDAKHAKTQGVIDLAKNQIVDILLTQESDLDTENLLTNSDARAIAQIVVMNTIAHEFYHLRQYYQNRDYFIDTSMGTEAIKKGETEGAFKYTTNPGERAARAFALRYIVEQRKILETKSTQGNITEEERLLLKNIPAYLRYEISIEKDISFYQHQDFFRKRALDVVRNSWRDALANVDENKRKAIIDQAKEAGIDPSIFD